jgi:hypothetical protein
LAYLLDRRAGKLASGLARPARAFRLVVGIEKEVEKRMVGLEVLFVLPENKGFKKPSGMGQVPFGRTAVRHRLQLIVFCFKRMTQLF